MNFLNEQYVKFLTSIRSEKGQTMVEYALLLVLIAIVVIVMIQGTGQKTSQAFSAVCSALVPN